MATPEVDFSSVFTVNNTTYNATNTYQYKVPPNKVLKLQELAITVSGGFTSGPGFVQITIDGRPITNAASATAEIQLLNTYAARWDANNPVWIRENSVIEVRYRVNAGSGSAQNALTGLLYDVREAEKEMARIAGTQIAQAVV